MGSIPTFGIENAVRSACSRLTVVEQGVRLAVVGDEVEAEVVCGLLRSSGIECGHWPADVAPGPGEMFGTGGAREVRVAPGDLDEARRILDAGDTSR